MYQKKPGPVLLRPRLLPRLALALAPLVGLAALVGVLLFGGLVHTVSRGVPVESLVVEDVRFTTGVVELSVRNDSPSPVTISQVMVDDAFRPFTVGVSTVDRLGSTIVSVPYPWESAIPIHVALLTSTGTVIEHSIEAPSLTPTGTPATLGMLTLIGLAMAAVPVALGLLWLPALRRASATVVTATLAFALGLLAFLLVDSTAEGLSLAAGLGALNGVGVFALGALGALAAFAAVESLGSGRTGPRLAWLVATGIGLHNLGEGLAVGTAMRVGEVALGTALVVGFAIHNLTEGVAIAAPLARPSYPQAPANQDQLTVAAGRMDSGPPPGRGGGRIARASATVRFWRLVPLVAVAGLPAVPGLWIGGLTGGGTLAVLGLGVAAGAIAQVLLSVGKLVAGRLTPLAAGSFVAAVALMYVTGLIA